MRYAVFGALVGFAVGWLVFGEREELTRAERGESAMPIQTSTKEIPSNEPLAPAREPAVDLRTADAAAIRHLAHSLKDSPTKDDFVAPAIARIEEARSSRNWKLFEALVGLLAASDSPEAEAKLIGLLGDTTLIFHDWRIAEHFVWGLSTSDLDGVVPAARTRIEFESTESNDRNRWRMYYEIVAERGSVDDVAWLLEHARKITHGMHDAVRAPAEGSANPAAAQKFIELSKAGSVRGEGPARTFAKNNPVIALPFYREQLLAARGDTARAMAQTYGTAVTTATLAEAKRFLLGISDPRQRTAAAAAVNAMQRNKLDISGLEPLLRAPADYARQLAAGDADARKSAFYDVLYGIEYNKLTWSEETAQALDDLARVYEHKGRADAYRDLAREIRAELGDDDSAWVTKD